MESRIGFNISANSAAEIMPSNFWPANAGIRVSKAENGRGLELAGEVKFHPILAPLQIESFLSREASNFRMVVGLAQMRQHEEPRRAVKFVP